MPNTQYNGKKEALTRLELEKILYSASEKVSSTILSSAMPEFERRGTIDLWELDNALGSVLNATVKSVGSIDPSLAEGLSFEIKRRKSTLLDDLVSLLLESLKDAYRESIEIDYPTPRIIHIRFMKGAEKTSFIRKEFGSKVYEILRHLIGM